ncbi:MAG: M23 family metallopeptidase [Anaerolineae bacterium]
MNILKRVWGIVIAGLFFLAACSAANEQNNPNTDVSSNNEVSVPATVQATAKVQLTPIQPTQTPIQLSTIAPTLSSPPTLAVENIPTEPAPACAQAELVNSGRICFTANNGDAFIHPISMVSNGRLAWLLDGGKILQIDLENQTSPAVILAPGDMVSEDPVQEPLDLSLIDLNGDPLSGLLVLDRVGDVYLYDLKTKLWVQDRYSRPIGTTSSHYYLSLATNGLDRFLLETSYRYGVRYLPDQDETGWAVDEEDILIDLSVLRGSAESFAYVLQRPIDEPYAEIIRYVQGQIDSNFRPNIEIVQPREIQVGPKALYLLDEGGLRLSVLNNENGTLLSQTEFDFPISTFALALDQFGSSIPIYAGKNAIYLPIQPETQMVIHLGDNPVIPSSRAPHDPQFWSQLPDLILPIENLPPDFRELRLPGAPRHYRQGIHEGMDFYWGPGREIRAVAAGTIIRADWDYIEPWPELFYFYRAEAAQLGQTSDKGLDFFRGRQVWIQHDNGFISRHAHLSTIDFNIDVGIEVAQGQTIGQVGNSGSPGSLDGPAVDSHLHFELWYGDQSYLGQYLRPIETRELIERIFSSAE